MKHIIQNSIGSVVYYFGLWAITMVISKVSINGYDDVGMFALSMSFCNVFLPVATLCARGYQVSDINNTHSNAHYVALRYATSLLGFCLCVTVALALGYRGATLLAIVLFMLYQVSAAYADVLHGICQKNGHLEYAAYSLAGKGVAGLLVFAAVLKVTQNLMVSMGAMAGLALLANFAYDRPRTRPYYDDRPFKCLKVLGETKSLLIACLPLMANSMLMPLLLLVPRLMIEKIYSVEMLGIFTSVTFPSVVVSTLANAAIVALVPHYAQAWQDKGRRHMLFLVMLPIAGILGCGLLVVPLVLWCGGWVLRVLYTQEISGYGALLSIAVVVSCILACVSFCNYVLIAMRKIKVILPLSALAFVIVLIGALPFIQNWNIYGATYILGLAYAIQLVAQVAFIGIVITRKSRHEPGS